MTHANVQRVEALVHRRDPTECMLASSWIIHAVGRYRL